LETLGRLLIRLLHACQNLRGERLRKAVEVVVVRVTALSEPKGAGSSEMLELAPKSLLDAMLTGLNKTYLLHFSGENRGRKIGDTH